VSAIRCPRCQAIIPAVGDPGASLICPGCGARLRTRSAPSSGATSASRTGSKTLPPGTPLPNIPRPPASPAEAGNDGPPTPAGPAPARPPAAAVGVGGETLTTLLAEVRAVKALQEEILALLRERPATGQGDGDPMGFGMGDDVPAPAPPPPVVRARRRKTVLLIDDDPATRGAATAALEKAEVPTRTAHDGNSGLAAIAQEKPDVIVMELDMGGSMGGKDVVNMIKATMEWVDIPILLYTRHPVENQKEARQIHGADEFVLKTAGPDALVARVITVFRKG
jgi:CheY-like chemotaxis protein